MRIVVAVGGNALLRRGERPDAAAQLDHIRSAAIALAPIIADHEVIVCHGNGPQVGLLARESTADTSLTRPYPLDALVAQTQGMIGYWLSQALRNAGVVKPIVNLTTQVCVDPDDPAFAVPTKFVGPMYTRAQAEAVVDQHGWSVAVDGSGWRRTVPSPKPVRMIEKYSINTLLEAGSVVVCGGGGGVPVVEAASGELNGIEAVIDKDWTAAIMALDCGARRLLILTDVPAVVDHFGTAQEIPLHNVYVDELITTDFAEGSMAPKIEACCAFSSASGYPAMIGSLDDAQNVLAGISGTIIADRRTEDISSGRGRY
ncbi:Carbamate kinase [Rhodococcus sp. AW25M09]|uniref:carbamate kinase n=1 Tax=Rhodococcus sp. AW25M09 TaxID=1268303 RepID=UPI0002AC19E5|nr:carbamate kinase [Rhodococcus sp. AW25M09]CCQ13537.1 Carbamate kinase [Rhodococcus sp. AW25M09]